MAAGTGRGADRMVPILLGVVLILAGAAWLLASLFNVDVSRYGWPLFVIAPGVVVLLAGLVTRTQAGIGMVTGGSVVTATGLLLAFQNVTGYWATWAYAWALIAPFATGLGLMLAGSRWKRPALVRNGGRTALVGLALFAAGFIFFEGLIGLSGRPLLQFNGTAWAALLIAVGVIWLVLTLVRRGPGDASNRG